MQQTGPMIFIIGPWRMDLIPDGSFRKAAAVCGLYILFCLHKH